MLRQRMKAPRKGALVALRDRREEVIELLCDHSARADHPKSGYALAVLGGTERKGVWRLPRTLRVLTCMGGVDVETRLPGESEKEARKRRRREPRQRRRQRHLPA